MVDAIAAYRGPITVIPRGVSGIPELPVGQGVCWKDQTNHHFANKLRGERLAKADAVPAVKPPTPRQVQAAARVEQLRVLVAQGQPRAEIIAAMGISEDHLRMIARRNGIELPRTSAADSAAKGRAGMAAKTAELRAQIAGMDDKPVEEVARIVGKCVETVRRYRRDLA